MWKKKQRNQKEEQFVRSKLLSIVLVSLFVFLSCFSEAVNTFHFNKNLLVAQQQNYELRLSRSASILQQELLLEPENCAITYLQHCNSFLKAFVSENAEDYQSYLKVRQSTINHLRELADTSPYKKFALSEVYFYSASLKAKFNELYGAARDVNKAHSVIEENHKSFPDFLPNNKTRGILKVYLATVPDNYAWIISMLGIKGNMSEGLRLLQTLAKHRQDEDELGGIAKEAAYLYSFSLMHVAKRPGKAWSETLKCTQDYQTNLISNFFRSNMALKLNKNETAIQVLSQRPVSKEFERFYLLNYMLGTAMLNKQDPKAIDEFIVFEQNYTGRNYVKSGLQKMSWYYLLKGDLKKADQYKTLIVQKGASLNEDDKLAIRYSQKLTPNRLLLQTRLLYDGGYYEKANQSISKINVKELPSNKLKAEYCYRKGRISEKQGEINPALKYYEACSLYAIDSDEYYGAYASIYLGEYHLRQSDPEIASKFFERALGFKKNKEYEGSIEQRAKAGLKKVGQL